MSVGGGLSRLRAAGTAAAADDATIVVLIAVVTSATSVLVALTAGGSWRAIDGRPWPLLCFVVLAFAFVAGGVDVYGRGGFSMAGSGFLAIGFAFGVGPAMLTALLASFLNFARHGGKLYRALYSASTWGLGSACGGLPYVLAGGGHRPLETRLLLAVAGGPLFLLVNVGLLAVAIALAEARSPREVWREQFRWMTPYYVASGPLALALVIAYEKLGITGLLAFSLPPIVMMISIRQYVGRTGKAVEEARAANDNLRSANEELAARNEDLRVLFEFTGGLASRVHDRSALVAYAEQFLSTVSGGRARIRIGPGSGGIALTVGGRQVGTLGLVEDAGYDAARWERLREALLPQLATALDSTELVDRVRKTHLDTIAALSRSMEAKDYYTGGHTERVAEIALALARRLGYGGAELDAIEIGALLHDIGKIGIPERILHKPGPLDDDEWKVMREHPVISEYILKGVDLHPIVAQIARSSHERIDGDGYPDRVAGAEIPLPARIVLVADALDALTSERPYRPARPLGEALEEVRANTGTQFCPTVVSTLEQLVREEPHLFGALPLHAVRVA